MIKNIKLGNGFAIVASSGHAPFSAVIFLDQRGRFLLACEDENRRCLDEDEMLQFAKENAPQIAWKPKRGSSNT